MCSDGFCFNPRGHSSVSVQFLFLMDPVTAQDTGVTNRQAREGVGSQYSGFFPVWDHKDTPACANESDLC